MEKIKPHLTEIVIFLASDLFSFHWGPTQGIDYGIIRSDLWTDCVKKSPQ